MRREYSYNIMKESHRLGFIPFSLFCAGIALKTHLRLIDPSAGTPLYVIYFVSLSVIIGTILWAHYLVTMRVYIDDEGITLKHPYRTISFRWDEIEFMQRWNYYSQVMDGPARDIRIQTKSGRTMKLYYFIRDEQGNEGIEIIEPELIKHTSLKIIR